MLFFHLHLNLIIILYNNPTLSPSLVTYIPVLTGCGASPVNQVCAAANQQQQPTILPAPQSTTTSTSGAAAAPGNAVMYMDSQGRVMTSAAVAALAAKQKTPRTSSLTPHSATTWHLGDQLNYTPSAPLNPRAPPTSTALCKETPPYSSVSGVDIVRLAAAECIDSKVAMDDGCLEPRNASKSLDEGLNPGDFLIKVIKEGQLGVVCNLNVFLYSLFTISSFACISLNYCL